MGLPSDLSDAWSGTVALGTLLGGRYRVDGVIGSGGMGIVLAATDERLGRPVALKLLPPGRTPTTTSQQRFLREARAAASIDSDHVVRIFDTGMLDEVGAFLAMERLEGQDLRQALLERGAFTPEEAIEIIIQACSAVDDAHRRGIVHRDLKPGNMFLVRSNKRRLHVKVLDFGVSKVLGEVPSADSLTDTGSAVGSPRYMSPEQVRDAKTVGPATDVWSLGVVLYELLAGATPFSGDSAPAIYAMIAADSPRPLRELVPSVPRALDAVCMRCLAKRAADRFGDARALAHALRSITADDSRGESNTDDGVPRPSGSDDQSSKTLDPTPLERPALAKANRPVAWAALVGAGVLVPIAIVALKSPAAVDAPPTSSASAPTSPATPVAEQPPEPVSPLTSASATASPGSAASTAESTPRPRLKQSPSPPTVIASATPAVRPDAALTDDRAMETRK